MIMILTVFVAQRIAHRTSNPGVLGSNPSEDDFLLFNYYANIIYLNTDIIQICPSFFI